MTKASGWSDWRVHSAIKDLQASLSKPLQTRLYRRSMLCKSDMKLVKSVAKDFALVLRVLLDPVLSEIKVNGVTLLLDNTKEIEASRSLSFILLFSFVDEPWKKPFNSVWNWPQMDRMDGKLAEREEKIYYWDTPSIAKGRIWHTWKLFGRPIKY